MQKGFKEKFNISNFSKNSEQLFGDVISQVGPAEANITNRNYSTIGGLQIVMTLTNQRVPVQKCFGYRVAWKLKIKMIYTRKNTNTEYFPVELTMYRAQRHVLKDADSARVPRAVTTQGKKMPMMSVCDVMSSWTILSESVLFCSWETELMK